MSGAAGPGAPSTRPPEDRWHLEDERAFLQRSLEDADQELGAGDLDPSDHRLLRRRDEARLAEVERLLAAPERPSTPGPPAPSDPVPSDPVPSDPVPSDPVSSTPVLPAADPVLRPAARHRRTWLAVVGTMAVVLGLVLLVVHLTAPRLLGETGDGTISLNRDQLIARELAQAAQQVDLGTVGGIEQGLGIYRQVLALDPRQPQALAETGYLEWETGFESKQAALAARGRALVETSIAVQGDDYAAHLFLGTIEFDQDARAAAAVAQFQLFLDQHPPRSLVRTAAPTIRKAFAAAGRPVPPGLPG